MSTPPYRITVDRDRGFVRMDMAGFWTMETAQQFAEDHRRTLRDNATSDGGILLLVNQLTFEVQSTEVIQLLGMLLETSLPVPRKAAVVASKAMLRMQGKRMSASIKSINTSATNIWFEDEVEALDWLLSDLPVADTSI